MMHKLKDVFTKRRKQEQFQGDQTHHEERLKETKSTESFGNRFLRTLESIRNYVNRNWWVTYAFAGVLFTIFSLILSSSNLYKQGQLSSKIHRLEHKLTLAQKQFKKDSLYLEGRRNSSDYELEQIAREQYLFKEPNEMVFVIEDTTSRK